MAERAGARVATTDEIVRAAGPASNRDATLEQARGNPLVDCPAHGQHQVTDQAEQAEREARRAQQGRPHGSEDVHEEDADRRGRRATPRRRQARQREAARALDKAVAKGIVHKRTAARRKSRLAKAASSVARRVAPLPASPVPTLPVDGWANPSTDRWSRTTSAVRPSTTTGTSAPACSRCATDPDGTRSSASSNGDLLARSGSDPRRRVRDGVRHATPPRPRRRDGRERRDAGRVADAARPSARARRRVRAPLPGRQLRPRVHGPLLRPPVSGPAGAVPGGGAAARDRSSSSWMRHSTTPSSPSRSRSGS